MECGNIFRKILVPISTKFFPKNALSRAIMLAGRFNSEVFLLYIVEDRVFHDILEVSSPALTHHDIQTIDDIIFSTLEKEGERLLQTQLSIMRERVPSVETRIVRGEFSSEVLCCTSDIDAELVILEYEKEVLFEYELFASSPIPIWVEKGGDIRRILMVSTNLAPNKKVPGLSSKLQEIFNAELHCLYVIDGIPRARKEEYHKNAGRLFEELCDLGILHKNMIETKITSGGLSREVMDAAREFHPDLVILGRIRKPQQLISRTPYQIKRKLAKSLPYNLLLVN